MKNLWFLGLLLCSLPQAQSQISGVVIDEQKKPLQGVSVFISETNTGVATDEKGAFLLKTLPAEKFEIHVSFIGYQGKKIMWDPKNPRQNLIIQLLPEAYHLQTLTVMATRAGDKSPFTYQNLKAEDFQATNLGQDVPYLLRFTPSAVVTSDAGTGIGYTGIRIRGSDPTRINVTINGIPLNDAESQGVFWVDLPDFLSSTQDIQIQRGVGTSTNGAGAFGASINLNTADYRTTPYLEINGTAGSFQTYKSNLRFGSGLLGQYFTLDGRISKINSGGFIDRARADLFSWYSSAAFIKKNTSLRVNIFSGKEVTYQAWCGVPAQFFDSNPRSTFNPCGLKADGTAYDQQVDDYKQTHYQLLWNQQLSPAWNAHAALHYTRGLGFYEEWRDQDLLANYGLPPIISSSDTLLESNLVRRRWLDNHFFGTTFSATHTQPGFTLTFGGGWNKYLGKHFGEVIFLAPNQLTEQSPRYYDNDANKTDGHLYAKAQVTLTHAWNAFADMQIRNIQYAFIGFSESGINLPQDVQYNFFNPKIGVFFQPSSKWESYLSFAVGNREPNRNDFTESSPRSRPRPETLFNTELGLKRTWSGTALQVNLYHMAYRDQLVLTGQINDVGAYTRENIEKSYRLGLELQGSGHWSRRWSWEGSATLSRNKIASFNEYVDNWATWQQEIITHSNTDLAFSPSVQSHLDLGFALLPDFRNWDCNLHFIAKYVGKQYIDNTSNDLASLDPYFFSDFRVDATWRPKFAKEINTYFLIQNLFNSQMATNAWNYRFVSPGYDPRPDDPYARREAGDTYHLAGYYPQAGINFLLGLSLKW